jgi:hypothetical protein
VDGLTRLGALTVAAVGLLLAAGCRDHAKPARHVFVSHVRAVSPSQVRGSQLHACLRRFPDLHVSGRTRVVERAGLLGASLTIFDPGSPWLYACDFTPSRRRVCGGAVGEWRGGRLNDPRLDILCTDWRGHPLGAAWVVPLPRARSVTVRERRITEVYAVAGRLPVRIWTREGVRYERSSADFDVTQRDRRGHALAHERLHAAVAG